MTITRRVAAIALPAILLLSACGSSTSGSGTTATQEAATTTSAAPTTSASPRNTHSSAASTSSSVPVPKVMPDFVGQTQSAAQAALAQYNVQIKTVNRIDAQPAGTVIEQDPVAGAPFAQVVTLTISTAPATVPDVTGKTFAEAQQQLTKLGFEVKENPIFDQKLADGLVQGQNPPADTANIAEVTLDVVRRPVVTYLADMEPVANSTFSGYAKGTQKANATTYTHGILLDPNNGAQLSTLEYDLSKQYRKLTGTLGMEDKSASASTGKVEIYGDGRQLFSQDIAFGQSVLVDVDVTDVLRLKITVAIVDGKGAVVFGDFAAQGLQSEVGASGSPTPTTTSR